MKNFNLNVSFIINHQVQKRLKENKKNDFTLAVETLKIHEDKGVTGIPNSMRGHKPMGNYKENGECHINLTF